MKKEEFIKLVQKYDQKRCSIKEKQLVENTFKKFQEKNRSLEIDFSPKRKEKIFSAILNSIENTQRISSSAIKRKLSIAACLLILIGTGLSFFLLKEPDEITHIARNGEKKEVILEDGSHLILNANSSVRFFKDFKNNREVYLKGEAFFQVARDTSRPFTINTGKVKTEVLGTTFNVNAYEANKIKVSVNTGKVKVKSGKPAQQIILLQNEQVIFEEGYSQGVTKGLSENISSWTRNIIYLEDTSLAETAKILENWYNISIGFDPKHLEELKISGKFKNESPQNILRSIALLKNLEIDTINQKQLYIREKTSN